MTLFEISSQIIPRQYVLMNISRKGSVKFNTKTFYFKNIYILVTLCDIFIFKPVYLRICYNLKH